MLDADGATQIADMENLEKGLDTLVDSHVSRKWRGDGIWGGGFGFLVSNFSFSVYQNRPAVAVGSRAHLQGEAVAKVRILF